MRQLNKFLNLSFSDRLLLVGTFTLLAVIRLGLWLLPFSTWHHLWSCLMPVQSKLQADPAPVDKVIWAVSIASHYMPGGVKCLARALVTQILLHRYGYPADLHIGVTKGEGGQLEAHAWVESQGQIVMGYLSNLSRFTPLPAFGGSRR
jgi:hypothetical protein